MKKLICVLLIATCLASAFVMPTTAASSAVISIPASQMEKKFVVDGNLDIWYIHATDETEAGDGNYYHYVALNPTEKSDGTSYYSEPDTTAQVWTAWDDTYVYIYVKVWDDNVVPFDKTGVHAGLDSSAADSVEIWFDPDPNSQTHTYEYDENGNIVKEIPRPAKGTVKREDYASDDDYKKAVEEIGEIEDLFCNQTNDPDQGDVQVRWLANEDILTDFHNIVNPNYGGITFSKWVSDMNNFCTFTFENDPVIVEETGIEVSSGYGVEARFPRHNDLSNNYRFHIAANNSAEERWERYALATGNAWWMSYDTAWNVGYVKNPPFFIQSEEQLATKGVMYTDSEVNKSGPAGQVVDNINALGTVTAADKEKVYALKAQYDALTVLEKGYVQYKNYYVLHAAIEVVDEETIPVEPQPAVVALIEALPNPADITLEHKSAVEEARAAYDALTDTQKELVPNLSKLEECEAKIAELETVAITLGDVNGDTKVTAADALEVLKSVVGKITLTDDQLKAADTDGTGTADAGDALNILKKVVGKIDKFPVEA